MEMLKNFDLKTRFRAAGVHLGLSALVALLAGAVVFGLWYPYPYRVISGGQSLFWLVVTVDLVLGPLLTWIVFDRRKPRAELVRDVSVIALLQLSALVYGLVSVYQARPVYLVHEVDRFRVTHRVITYDLRGQGRSEHTRRGLGLDSLAEDAAELIRALQSDRDGGQEERY